MVLSFGAILDPRYELNIIEFYLSELVAPESTFSKGGRIISKYRSSLCSTSAEALLCTRDWLFGLKDENEIDEQELILDIEKLIQPSSKPLTQDDLKKLATDKAVAYVSSSMVLGLGIGSTSAFVVDKIGQLLASGQLTNIIEVPTSKRTQEQAASLCIPLSILHDHPKLDLAIDGADEVDPDLKLVKGKGGALLREKMMEATSVSLVVVAATAAQVCAAKEMLLYR
uniref:ribose-5-phosphate isomerase n=1 Tax=Tanacetum cinerariifolium TaxID=118510 RepID=A0A6L2MKV3_TANCI|nr:probable ribose-5-phosphate isomerase 3, chloroplastic [Tanacetum cinerariifolium]